MIIKNIIYNQESIPIYDNQEIEKIRKACKLASLTLDYINPFVKPGVSTEQLNSLCHDFIINNNAVPAPLNYNGYPKSICTSVNHVVCHGIPSENHILTDKDIINIDVTVILDGFFGDTSKMYTLGRPSIKAQNLVNTTYECLWAGIEAARPGGYLGDIGYSIEKLAHSRGFSVVEDFCGHGIGKAFHHGPQVLHFGKANTGIKLEPGMVFTIEPMINAGKKQTKILPDNWTAITKDRSLSAQFEHTIVITETGNEVLTLAEK